MVSKKTKVIEYLFQQRWDSTLQQPIPDLVKLEDITAAIDATGVGLSKRNPANFWKDFIRRASTANANWPASVFEAGFTGDDAIGAGDQASFRFVPVSTSQETPFRTAISPAAHVLEARISLQSLSLPITAKQLGRTDENWIAQVCVRLGVVEAYFAQFSSKEVAEVSFVQTGVRLGRGEVDAVWRVVDAAGDVWLVSAEVKSRNEDVWLPQVRRAAVELASTQPAQALAGVIPFAIKALNVPDLSVLHVIEFQHLGDLSTELVISSEGAIELNPAVQGV